MSEVLRHYTNEFRASRDVSPYDAEVFFDKLIAERDVDVITQLLDAWATKGTTEDELYRFAAIMRSRMRPLLHDLETVVDIVGTGGSAVKTFNVSTAAAFVIAGAGVAVAKHGNRAATSSSGSADVLAELGIYVDVEPEISERYLAKHGMCFMFAPRFHSLSPQLAAARRSLGRPTIFNNLGPICNPANVAHQVVGVSDIKMLDKTARALARFGTKRSWVVNGGGLDEIALDRKTSVAEVSDGSMLTLEIDAREHGLTATGNLPARCSPKESATVIEAILSNEAKDTDAEQLVLINAAAALHIAGDAKTLKDGIKNARRSIRDGAALDKLTRLRKESGK